jgi:hypothetical protein
MGSIPPLHEIVSPPKGEEPYAPKPDYSYLQDIRTVRTSRSRARASQLVSQNITRLG